LTKMNDYYKTEAEKLIQQHGDVPPPWIHSPSSHPYSIEWRMGAGEDYLGKFAWFHQTHLTNKEQSINYFKKYPPEPRWVGWTCDVIFDLEPWEEDEFDYAPYIEKLASLGFKDVHDYEKDLNDPKWLKN